MKVVLESKLKFSLLHAVRGVAALYVVVYHARFILWSGTNEYLSKFPRASWNCFDYALSGVDLLFSAGSQMVIIFFVLSGFFIPMSLQNNSLSSKNRYQQFYAVRCIRIYIPYIASLILGTAFLYATAKISPHLFNINSNREFNVRLIAAKADITWANFFRALCFTKYNEYIGLNFAYWSLLYEGIFYLIVPLVIKFKKKYLLLSGILYLAGVIIINLYHPRNILLKFFVEYNFYFAVGVFLNLYLSKVTTFIQPRKNRLTLIALCIGLFGVIDLFALKHCDFYANLVSAFFGSLLIILLLNSEGKNKIAVRMFNKLGQVSYSLYLVHIPVLVLCYSIVYYFTNQVIIYSRIYMLGVIASVLIAIAFYKIIEQPSLALVNRIKHRNKKPCDTKGCKKVVSPMSSFL